MGAGQEVLLTGRLDEPATFFRDGGLIQHSPTYGDGVDAFRTELSRWSDKRHLRYERVHKVLGQGNLFLVMSEGMHKDKAAALYDLYRLRCGSIVEHWEIFEAIPPRSEWKNDKEKPEEKGTVEAQNEYKRSVVLNHQSIEIAMPCG
jgi:predicted SnoaL-like aldol condensation-catalyzing enzyme